MAQRKPTEKTHKFLEITDPKKAVGLWSYRVVRETPMTPVGKTAQALGRFLNGDIVRWEHRARMAEALVGKRVGLKGGISPSRAIGECLAEADADKNRLTIPEWREKYAWLLAWSRYATRLAAPNVIAAEKDVQMFFDAPSAGVNCHEGDLHSGRVFFLRTKLPVGLNADRLRDTQSFDRIGAARPLETPSGLGLSPSGNPTLSRGRIPTARVESSSSVAPTPQLDSVEGSSHPKNASGSFPDSGVGSEATVVAGSENDLLSRSAQADCVQKSQYRYFVAVVLKPGGTKWWSQIDKTNVTWTDNVYDRLIIDPRGKLEWSPILAEVINEQVAEKNICLFMLEDDALFKAITNNELNPNEKYAHLCYAFDFFYRQGEKSKSEVAIKRSEIAEGLREQRNLSSCASGLEKDANNHCTTSTSRFDFYLRWSAFINPKRSKFTLVSKQKPRVIEVMSERKKGWTSRQIEVKDRDWGLGIRDSGLEVRSVRHGNKSLKQLSREEAARRQTNDAKLGLGDTPLDRYAQEVARWVVENNGCAVLPIGASRELRLALSHALFFVTLPDRKPNEVGGILRGYQLPGRLVEHVTGKLRGDNLKVIKERVQKHSEEATARRRKMIVDCLFTRACVAVLSRNRDVVLNADRYRDTQKEAFSDVATTARVELSSSVAPTPQSKNALSAFDKVTEKTIVPIMESIGARATIEKAAWQRGFMEGNPLNQFMPGPMAGINKLPNLSLALCFEHKLGLKGETAGDELLVQTSPIRPLKEAQGSIRHSISGVYPCKSLWTPKPGTENERIIYATDTLRIIRDEGRFYLMAMPKYTIYRVERDLAYEPDVKGKKRKDGVPVRAVNVVSGTGARSRSDVSVTEELFEYNKVMQMARDGRLMLFSIDFGRDKWLADIVYSEKNSKPCKIVPSLPVLSETGVAKKDAFSEDQISGSEYRTRIKANTETCDVHITFTFNPTVDRDRRKVEGRSWKSYLDAFPAEAQRTVVRWPSAEGLGIGDQGLGMALQEVIETDGVLLTDKEHLEEALRAATYVIPAPSTKHKALSTSPYDGLNLKDRIFKDTDGRAEWRKEKSEEYVSGLNDKQKKNRAALNAKYEAQRKEQKGKPLCEVLSPDLAKEAEAEFTRQIEADTLVDAKTPKDFKLEEPIRVGDDFKDAVAREFKRIAYTGTMGWRQKLKRPAHEVAVGIWLSRLAP